MSWISRRWAGWFDGQDDYVYGTGNIDFGEISFYSVIRWRGFVAGKLFRASSYNWRVIVGITSTNRLWIELFDDNQNRISSFTIPEGIIPNKIYYFSFVYDKNKIVAYLNGNVYEYYPSDYGYSLSDVGDITDFYIGAYNSNDIFWSGEIYMEAIWNRALTDDEIAKLNEDPFNPDNVSKDGLVGWWDFNKADWSNGILPDLSGSGNDGQMYGVTRRDVLVKRGIGDLPQYDLGWSWVCDGIDDYVIADFNNWAVTKAMSFAVWDRVYAGSWAGSLVKDYAKGIGYYDSSKDAWRVDGGEKGYFFEREIEYDEKKFGRGIWFYVYGVQVDDNSQNVPLFRFEVEDVNSGEVVFSYDYAANRFPTSNFSSIVTAGYGFVPYGHYKFRLYSYGNVGFWIREAEMEGLHGSLLHSYGSSDFRIYRYYGYLHLLVWKTDGSYKWFTFDHHNSIRRWENFILGWSNLEQKSISYFDGQPNGDASDTAGLDMRGVATQIIFGTNDETAINNRYTGEVASIMLFDRLLSDTEASDLYNRKFVLDGLVHWWVVDGNGNLVDLVSGKSYQIQGNPNIREIHDDEGRLNSGVGKIVFDLIVEERGM